MISICIPIYNIDVNTLVATLSLQMQRLEVPCEMILIDDASQARYKAANQPIAQTHRYIALKKNIGRAAIRNLFVKYARYDYLLFLDCDVLIHSNDFLKTYVTALQSGTHHVLCGGRTYSNTPPNRSHKLRWHYGRKRESKTAAQRNQTPNVAFASNNFITTKAVLQDTSFDERLYDYGHEDTFFGFLLKKKNITISHIENPVRNGHLDSNKSYLLNTEKAIHNLTKILIFTNYNKDFIADIKLLDAFQKYGHFAGIIRLLFFFTKPAIRYSLKQGIVSLKLFDFYKLGTLSTLESGCLKNITKHR